MTRKPTVSFHLNKTPKRQAVGSNPAKCAKAPETKGCLRRSCLPMPAMAVGAPFSRAARGLLRTPPNDRRTRLNNRRKSSNNQRTPFDNRRKTLNSRRAAPNNRRKLLDNRRTPFNNRRKPSNNRRNFQTTKISIEITKELLRLPAENRRNVLPAAKKGPPRSAAAGAWASDRGEAVAGHMPLRCTLRATARSAHARGSLPLHRPVYPIPLACIDCQRRSRPQNAGAFDGCTPPAGHGASAPLLTGWNRPFCELPPRRFGRRCSPSSGPVARPP